VERHVYSLIVVSVSYHYENPSNLSVLVWYKADKHHHLIEMQLVLAMLWLKICSLGVKQYSLTCFS
jgi:hypothetical protein